MSYKGGSGFPWHGEMSIDFSVAIGSHCCHKVPPLCHPLNYFFRTVVPDHKMNCTYYSLPSLFLPLQFHVLNLSWRKFTLQSPTRLSKESKLVNGKGESRWWQSSCFLSELFCHRLPSAPFLSVKGSFFSGGWYNYAGASGWNLFTDRDGRRKLWQH